MILTFLTVGEPSPDGQFFLNLLTLPVTCTRYLLKSAPCVVNGFGPAYETFDPDGTEYLPPVTRPLPALLALVTSTTIASAVLAGSSVPRMLKPTRGLCLQCLLA